MTALGTAEIAAAAAEVRTAGVTAEAVIMTLERRPEELPAEPLRVAMLKVALDV